jgi:GAF domain-containing protein
MPLFHDLTDEALITQTHELRWQALQGSPSAHALSREHQVELRGGLKRSTFDGLDQPTKDDCLAMADSQEKPDDEVRLQALSTITARYLVATADAASNTAASALSELLRNVRTLLAMDIAFVSEFSDGRRIFRHVDADPSQPRKLEVGQSDLVEETYCQRVVDGRLPLAIPNTAALPEARELAVTESLNIRAYLSAPVVLADGEIYGTLCCISHQTRSALGSRQVDALRTVADLISTEIEKSRRGTMKH